MERKKVKSSNIASVGYEPKKMLLEIEFGNGSIYQYHPITSEAYHEMLKADSVGKYFYKNIRSNDDIKNHKMN